MKAQKRERRNVCERIPAPTLSQSNTKSGYYKSKEERAQDARKRTRIKKIEDEITALEEENDSVNAEISTPEVATNFPLLTEKCNRLDAIKTRLDELYAEYETVL